MALIGGYMESPVVHDSYMQVAMRPDVFKKLMPKLVKALKTVDKRRLPVRFRWSAPVFHSTYMVSGIYHFSEPTSRSFSGKIVFWFYIQEIPYRIAVQIFADCFRFSSKTEKACFNVFLQTGRAYVASLFSKFA